MRWVWQRIESWLPMPKVGLYGFFVFAAALVFLRDGLARRRRECEGVDFLVDAVDVVGEEGLAIETGVESEGWR
jgi:hypothetical protein